MLYSSSYKRFQILFQWQVAHVAKAYQGPTAGDDAAKALIVKMT